mmetsp:Transcript_10311/g.26203  ORF Transcript_10311/g.26203 Transcript_10311/m.26203 type:complete len:271 (-) Transcript_10311:1203-2015(-)
MGVCARMSGTTMMSFTRAARVLMIRMGRGGAFCMTGPAEEPRCPAIMTGASGTSARTSSTAAPPAGSASPPTPDAPAPGPGPTTRSSTRAAWRPRIWSTPGVWWRTGATVSTGFPSWTGGCLISASCRRDRRMAAIVCTSGSTWARPTTAAPSRRTTRRATSGGAWWRTRAAPGLRRRATTMAAPGIGATTTRSARISTPTPPRGSPRPSAAATARARGSTRVGPTSCATPPRASRNRGAPLLRGMTARMLLPSGTARPCRRMISALRRT